MSKYYTHMYVCMYSYTYMCIDAYIYNSNLKKKECKLNTMVVVVGKYIMAQGLLSLIPLIGGDHLTQLSLLLFFF